MASKPIDSLNLADTIIIMSVWVVNNDQECNRNKKQLMKRIFILNKVAKHECNVRKTVDCTDSSTASKLSRSYG